MSTTSCWTCRRRTSSIRRTRTAPPARSPIYTAAVGDFSRFIGGDRGGSSPLGLNLTGGLLADEIFSARAGTESIDNRNINFNNFPIDSLDAGGQHVRAVDSRDQAPRRSSRRRPADRRSSRRSMRISATFSRSPRRTTATAFRCGTARATSNITTQTFSTDQLYAAAIAQFDSALTLAPPARLRQLRARRQGARRWSIRPTTATLAANTAAAAALVGEVPTSYSVADHVLDAHDRRRQRDLRLDELDEELRRVGQGRRNGLDYVSSKDPRIKVDGTKAGRGQDGTPTPAMNQYPTLNSNVVIASGIEARMIEAEAQLAAGNTAAFLATLNAARATVVRPARRSPIRERPAAGRTCSSASVRSGCTPPRIGLGDMRRLIRQYGRSTRIGVPDRRVLQGRLVRHGRDARSVAAGDEQPELDGLHGQERVVLTRWNEIGEQAA